MNLIDQVCSLELAKRMKELGVKQESLFCYTDRKNDVEFLPTEIRNEGVCTAAFTVAELGEMLGFWVTTRMVNKKLWECRCHFMEYEQSIQAETEADARAKMLIYLIENNLLPKETQ